MICGLTAMTTTLASRTSAPLSVVVRILNRRRSVASFGASMSLATTCSGRYSPAATSPLISAVAMLPPPTKPINGRCDGAPVFGFRFIYTSFKPVLSPEC